MTNESQSDLEIKSAELQLKKDEFEFRKQEQARLHRLERIKTWGTVVSLAVGAVGLVIPVWIAAINIREQRRLAQEQASLTFQLKVAELALMNANKAEQVRERARAFTALFNPNRDRKSLLPPDFASNFEPDDFKLDIGHSVRTREELIALLAQHPQQRNQLIADWYVLFPWHQWWIQPILDTSADEKRVLDERSRSLQENEKRLSQKPSRP